MVVFNTLQFGVPTTILANQVFTLPAPAQLVTITGAGASMQFSNDNSNYTGAIAAPAIVASGYSYIKVTGATAIVQVAQLALSATGPSGIKAYNRLTGQVAAVNPIVSFTPPVDSSLMVSGNVLITSSSSFSFTINIVYTDEGGTGRTISMAFGAASGFAIGAAAITSANGAAPYHGFEQQIRAKGGTTVTLVTAGTFTTVTYNVEGLIRSVQP